MVDRRAGRTNPGAGWATALLVASLACAPGHARGQPLIRSVPPDATDPAVEATTGDHLVAHAGGGVATGYLVLFYPGTGATPEDYATLLTHAASRGHHVIGLAYRNEASVNFVYCRGQIDSSCHAEVRTEILTGENASGLLEVDEPNSAFGRLRRLLAYLADRYPEERWDSFLDDGAIAWNRVIVAGQSQGGGHAAFTAKLRRVARAVLFSATEPAPWTAEAGATPVEAFFALVHEFEPNFTGIVNSWTKLAVPGALTGIDDEAPPYGGSQQLVTRRTDCSGDPESTGFYHNCTSADAFLPPPDDEGGPAFADVWDRLFVLQPGGLAGPVFVAGPMGQAGSSYIDPELLASERLLTYQDGAGTIALASVDRADGRFRVAGGGEQVLDTGAWPVIETFNGPEFGVDANGWAVFYTKENAGIASLWRARLEQGVPVAEPLSAAFRRHTVLASKDPAADQTRLLFLRGPRGTGEVTWQDEDDPLSETPLGFYDEGVRWIDGQRRFVRTLDQGAEAGQLVLVDTVTGTSRQITDDAGSKRFPYGFVAPESGRLRVLALIDGDTAIGVWEDPGDGGPFERIALLRVPGAEGRTLGSPEPFLGADRSWVSFVLREDLAGGPAEVWLGRTDGELLWRCDDGEVGLARSDPETLVDDLHVFVYYNVIDPGSYRLYRCASELPGERLLVSGFETKAP